MADVTKMRSFILVGHAGCGKTSLAEAMLFKAGATTRQGKVEDGNTVSDYTTEEIDRQVSIGTGILNCEWKGHTMFILDAPGYADFIGDSIGAMRAADSGIVVVDATTGVEVGTERMWNLLDKDALPRAIIINRLDKENADFLKTIQSIRDALGKHCAPVQFPDGEKHDFKGAIDIIDPNGISRLSDQFQSQAEELRESLVESVAESDDALLEKYLGEGTLSVDEIKKGLRSAVVKGSFVPIFCTAAPSAIGVEQVLDAVTAYLPSTIDRVPFKGADTKSNEEVEIVPGDGNAFRAQVFKTVSDPYVGQLTIFKVIAGSLKADTGFYNVTKSAKERFSHLYVLQGKEQRQVPVVEAGYIGAVAKLKETQTGDTLGEDGATVLFPAIVFPEPAMSSSVKPRSRGDEDKISGALHKLVVEDPTFKVSRDAQTKEMLVSGLGDMHIDVMMARLKSRFHVEVDLGVPKVAYKETITKTAKVQGKHKKQSGGRGQYGDVWLELEPLERGGDFEFVDKVVGGVVPRNYIPSVEKGVRNAMAEGALAGYPLVDVRVTIYDGSFHPVDSSDMAFQIAGGMALKKGVHEAGGVLLEPIMDVEIVIPDEYMGTITGDLNSRRGRIMGMSAKGSNQEVKAQIPLAEILKYATDLRSMTQGRGAYTMRFSHYEIVPSKITQSIVEKTKAQKEEAAAAHH